ncbi:outer membrane lipoprotein carrier protein LolA [Hellea sp.]|nr:outer membrane lipoprotein carrier protein LolA [Hellea sp.]
MKKFLMMAAALTLTAPVAIAQVQPQLNGQNAPRLQAAPSQAAFTDPRSVPADLARVDAAMNSTASFSGRFAQYAADGSFAQGQVYIRRPGKLRFEYDAPNPLLIVSDGVTLTQQDKALETIDRVPLAATPLNYFLKENIDLANDTEVIGLQKTYNEWRVTARDGSGELDGAITMVFDANTLALKEWIIADNFGGETRVLLSDLKYNERINPRLFVLRDDSRRDRRR